MLEKQETVLVDMLKLSTETIFPLDDIGFVRLVDCMPRLVPEGQTADQACVQAARVSYGDGTKTVEEDRGNIRYMHRHGHTTPTEMVEFKFHCKMPVFVARQWIRHRTASVNEASGRYSVIKDEFFKPTTDDIRAQSKSNKQGSEGQIEYTDARDFASVVNYNCNMLYKDYEKALKNGVTREQARMVLPLNMYTEWYWKIDLHNLLHFLGLRCDSHAQHEIRVYADAMLKLITPIVPWTIEAWNDYHPLRGAVKLTRLEVEALRSLLASIKPGQCRLDGGIDETPNIDTTNKREQQEWLAKAKKLGF